MRCVTPTVVLLVLLLRLAPSLRLPMMHPRPSYRAASSTAHLLPSCAVHHMLHHIDHLMHRWQAVPGTSSAAALFRSLPVLLFHPSHQALLICPPLLLVVHLPLCVIHLLRCPQLPFLLAVSHPLPPTLPPVPHLPPLVSAVCCVRSTLRPTARVRSSLSMPTGM